MKRVVRTKLAVLGAGCLLLSAGAITPSFAEIVHLTSGRTMNVAGHRFEGEMAVLALRSGGEMSMPKALVAKVTPDEVPWVPEVRQVRLVREVRVVPAVVAPAKVEALIAAAAAAHDVDASLVRAVIKVESAFRPKARSRKGAMGLMQLMPATARHYGVRNAYDPAENIDAGVRHLRRLLDRYDVRLAVAAYNAGEGTVERYGGVPPYRETRDYVRKVLAFAGVQ